jgi:ElaB/YqjD/DUF883 family membrane-anchored ribosome-binding protein
MKSAHHQTVDGIAVAAERISDELLRAKQRIAGSAADAGEDLAAELRRLQHDLNAVKETIAGFGKASGAEASEAASRIGAAASDAASEFAGNAKHDAASVMADLETFARKNPRYVLGGALATGVVLGLLLRRS